jgi:hypothetical protein
MAYQGGLITYPDYSPNAVYFRAEGRATKTVTIKSGQVLKARSFLESDSSGKCIAHSGLVESATVLINAALANTQTLTVGTSGIVFTVGSGGATVAQLVAAMAVLTPAMTTTQANAALLAASIPTTVGTYTSGTAPAFTFSKLSATTALASASVSGNVTDLAVTASFGATPTVTIKSGATVPAIAGVVAFDVDASAGDVVVSAFTEASFWASALVWSVDPTVDTILKDDGVTTVACTAYNTGCNTDLLKAKFVENTEFEPLGFLKAGELL